MLPVTILGIGLTVLGIILTVYGILSSKKVENLRTRTITDIVKTNISEVISSLNDEDIQDSILPNINLLKIGDIRIYQDRKECLNAMTNILSRITKGDIIFGSCQSCTGYPPAFFDELYRSIDKTNMVHILINKQGYSIELRKQLKKLNPKLVDIRETEQPFLRFFGIKGKEVKLVIFNGGDYFCLHFSDPRIIEIIWEPFFQLYENSREVRLSDL